MTMRATVQRNTPAGTDGFGGPGAAVWANNLASQRCWSWAEKEREVIDGTKSVLLADHKMIVPLGTDITEDDRVTAIQDRLGANIIANTMRIHSVLRRANHLVCTLEEVA
jgi:hypothetical protein